MQVCKNKLLFSAKFIVTILFLKQALSVGLTKQNVDVLRHNKSYLYYDFHLKIPWLRTILKKYFDIKFCNKLNQFFCYKLQALQYTQRNDTTSVFPRRDNIDPYDCDALKHMCHLYGRREGIIYFYIHSSIAYSVHRIGFIDCPLKDNSIFTMSYTNGWA